MVHIKLLQEHFLPKSFMFLENLRIVIWILQKWLFLVTKMLLLGKYLFYCRIIL